MAKRYPSDQRERTVQMAMDRLDEYPSPWAAAQALGPKLGVGPETLRKWIVQAQVDGGVRDLDRRVRSSQRSSAYGWKCGI